jgi:hypothetical protein
VRSVVRQRFEQAEVQGLTPTDPQPEIEKFNLRTKPGGLDSRDRDISTLQDVGF